MRLPLNGLWLLLLSMLPLGFAEAGNLKVAGNLEQRLVPPVVVGSVGLGNGLPNAVVVSGRYAYVVDQDLDDLKIIDVSNPTAPAVVGSLAIGALPQSLDVSGRYAYVLEAIADELQIIDVSDPTTPVKVGSVGFGAGAIGVFVSGRYAYVIDQFTNLLTAIDVSDPTAPAVVDSIGVGNPISIDVSGRYAYIVDVGSNRIRVIDLSDPTALAEVGSLQIGSNLRSIKVSGRYAYVVDFGSYRIIDVSDPTAPTEVGGGNLAINTERAIFVSGRYAFMLDRDTGPNPVNEGLKIIDVADPTAPAQVGVLDIGPSPRRLYVSGRYVYVVDDFSNDLKIVDISGGETGTFIAHSVEAGHQQVRDDLIVQGQVQVTGGVGIGAGGLFVDGDTAFAGNVNVIGDLNVIGSCSGCSSDRRLKQNVQPVMSALERITQINGVRWEWKAGTREAHAEPGPQLGLVAEDVTEVFPELVGTDSRGYQYVDYSKLVGPLIESVKTLKDRNEALRATSHDMLHRLDRLAETAPEH